MFMRRALLVILLCRSLALRPTGFGPETALCDADGWQAISYVATALHEDQRESRVQTYDPSTGNRVWARVRGAARITVPCYLHIALGPHLCDLLRCSPTQRFYVPAERAWKEAIGLCVGDELLTIDGTTRAVTNTDLIAQAIDLYALSIDHPHTFFIGIHRVLTHNMALPAIAAAAAIPGEIAVVGSQLALQLGPMTCGASVAAAAGIGLGFFIYHHCARAGMLPSHRADCDPNKATAHYRSHQQQPMAPKQKQSPKDGRGGPSRGPDRGPEHKSRVTDKVANIYELFARAGFGEALREASEPVKDMFKGSRVFRLVKDLAEYGMQKGDRFYLDTLHRDHLEVFRGSSDALRTVVNLDGSCNVSKTLYATGRVYVKK